MEFTNRQIEIIEAATFLIGKKGIQNLTTKNLAQQMSFSEPALYRHFKNKTEIIKSVLLFYRSQLKVGITQIIEKESSAIDKIKSMIDFQFAHFVEFPAIIMVIFSETSFQYDTELSTVVSNIIEKKSKLVEGIIQKGITEGSIRSDISAQQMTTLVLGTMRFSVLKWRLSKFDFDLIKEGKRMGQTLELTIGNTK